ncbi:MAG: hypothetical protein GX868_04975, partial [Actinobacteria bacterium]|nr:hypothetical protein [Actinomycetota bacterium]
PSPSPSDTPRSGASRSDFAALDWGTVWRAAVSTATFVLPIAILQMWLRETDRIEASDPLNLFLYAVILGGGALGGFAASKLAPRLPLQHGAAAPALTVLAIQFGGAIRRLIAGEEISSPLGWVLIAMTMAVMGMFGAWVNEQVAPPKREE